MDLGENNNICGMFVQLEVQRSSSHITTLKKISEHLKIDFMEHFPPISKGAFSTVRFPNFRSVHLFIHIFEKHGLILHFHSFT